MGGHLYFCKNVIVNGNNFKTLLSSYESSLFSFCGAQNRFTRFVDILFGILFDSLSEFIRVLNLHFHADGRVTDEYHW